MTLEMKINGKLYPYKFTMAAGRKFKKEFGVNHTQADFNDPDHLIAFIYLGLEAGAKIDGKELDIKRNYFDDLSYQEVLEFMESVLPEEEGDPKQ